MHHYDVKGWDLPEGYLCAPIPGRADYIHHLADLVNPEQQNRNIKGLDIGVGANCIYPILGTQIYQWEMTGVDSDKTAVTIAQQNVDYTEALKKRIKIRYQANKAFIFNDIIKEGEFFDFTMCNPPFYTSEEEAYKITMRKNKKLGTESSALRNFGGQAHELWCNGGEALFIKRMIKQSVLFKEQVGWFTTLVAKKEHLPKLIKQLDKLHAQHKVVSMEQGHKKSRFLAWRFTK